MSRSISSGCVGTRRPGHARVQRTQVDASGAGVQAGRGCQQGRTSHAGRAADDGHVAITALVRGMAARHGRRVRRSDHALAPAAPAPGCAGSSNLQIVEPDLARHVPTVGSEKSRLEREQAEGGTGAARTPARPDPCRHPGRWGCRWPARARRRVACRAIHWAMAPCGGRVAPMPSSASMHRSHCGGGSSAKRTPACSARWCDACASAGAVCGSPRQVTTTCSPPLLQVHARPPCRRRRCCRGRRRSRSCAHAGASAIASRAHARPARCISA